jgi:electron transfer flavoprotein alpha subunit
MSVLVYIEQNSEGVKKSSVEAAYYASKVAEKLGSSAVGVVLGTASASALQELGAVGLSKVLHVSDAAFDSFDSKAYTKAVAELADKEGAKVVVLPFNQNGKALGPRLSVRLKAGFVPGATSLPDDNFTVKKTVYSGKAFASFEFLTDRKVIALSANSLQVAKGSGSAAVENASVSVSASDFGTKVLKVETIEGEIPLTEAELVVSAGRGLKGPENWGIIEDLAKTLGAATACSRPVSDIGWRPHHEHVGQTGVTVKPNLYIAVGISGAIQHLAGVNQSKVLVVINNDPEAPFFKAADYGVIGDAFEVVPKLNEAFKKFKASNN